jgi:forkhead box protein K
VLTCLSPCQKSVRHNLSSGRAFTKLEKNSTEEKGKGFYWTISDEFEAVFVEQEAKAAAAASAPPKKKKTPKEARGGPLPPPFASTPLMFKSAAAAVGSVQQAPLGAGTAVIGPGPGAQPQMQAQMLPVKRVPNGVVDVKMEQPAPMTAAMMATLGQLSSDGQRVPSPATPRPFLAAPVAGPSALSAPMYASASTPTPALAAAPTAAGPSSIPPLDPSIRVPIVVGPLPASYVAPRASAGAGTEPFKTPPIVLHENTLILDPAVFAPLGAARLRELEALGAQRALEALQVYIVGFLKERMRGAARSRARGKARGKGRVAGGGAREGAIGAVVAGEPVTVNGGAAAALVVPAPLPGPSRQGTEELIVVDDEEEEPASKKRRLEAG